MNRDHGSVHAIPRNGWHYSPTPFSGYFHMVLYGPIFFVHVSPQVYKGSWEGRVVSWFYRTFMDSFPPKMTNGVRGRVDQNKYPQVQLSDFGYRCCIHFWNKTTIEISDKWLQTMIPFLNSFFFSVMYACDFKDTRC